LIRLFCLFSSISAVFVDGCYAGKLMHRSTSLRRTAQALDRRTHFRLAPDGPGACQNTANCGQIPLKP
jgi:hypothetical protein